MRVLASLTTSREILSRLATTHQTIHRAVDRAVMTVKQRLERDLIILLQTLK